MDLSRGHQSRHSEVVFRRCRDQAESLARGSLAVVHDYVGVVIGMVTASATVIAVEIFSYDW